MLICHFKALRSKCLHCSNGTCLIRSRGKKYFVTNCHNGIITSKMMELQDGIPASGLQQSALQLWNSGHRNHSLRTLHDQKLTMQSLDEDAFFICVICIRALLKGCNYLPYIIFAVIFEPIFRRTKRVENCCWPVGSS